MNVEEGTLFKHAIDIILLDGPIAGEYINPRHMHSEELIVYRPRPVNLTRGELNCIPPVDVVRPHYRYKFVDFTCDMRQAFYKYDGEM